MKIRNYLAAMTVAAMGLVNSAFAVEEDAMVARLAMLEAEVAHLNDQLNGAPGAPAPAPPAVDDPSYGYDKHDGCADYCCDCVSYGGFTGGVEVAVLEPHLATISLGGVNLTPQFDGEASPRVWVGYEMGDGFGIRARWWEFDQTTNDASIIGELLMDDFAIGLENETFDIEFTQAGDMCGWELLVSGGIRYGRQRLSIGGNLGDAAVPFGVSAEYEGFGPTVSFAASRCIGNNLSIIAGGRGSLLYGDTDIGASGVLAPLDGLIGVDEQVMRVWELRLGLQYDTCMNGYDMFARATIEAQSWESGSVLGLIDSDLGYIGPAFAIGVGR